MSHDDLPETRMCGAEGAMLKSPAMTTPSETLDTCKHVISLKNGESTTLILNTAMTACPYCQINALERRLREAEAQLEHINRHRDPKECEEIEADRDALLKAARSAALSG